jgi:hypothetical protein
MYKLLMILMFLSWGVSSAGAEPPTKKISSAPTPTVLDLSKQPLNASWIGKTLNTVLGPSVMERAVICDSRSSAPPDHLIKKVQTLLVKPLLVIDKPKESEKTLYWFDVVFIMKGGQLWRVRLGENFGLINIPTGAAYFKLE